MVDSIQIKTGVPAFDDLIPRVKSFLEKDVLDLEIEGKRIRGYRSPDARSVWIRDYSDMLRGIKYFESDVQSVVDHFIETQSVSGRIFDYFTTFPEKQPSERENWTKYVRVPVEADVEFRLVKAAYLAWQATGDDDWILKLLPKLEKALFYIQTHPHRWSKTHGVVKRPYTIDTWDFAYTAGKHDWLQFQIDEDTFWGVFHGDNSGYYEAFFLMARIYDHFGLVSGVNWKSLANDLQNHLNDVCWNGTFYTHFVKETPVDIPGCNEENQLSLSNPMAINRGITSHNQAVSIIEEYLRRKETIESFAEWFSIDPPFPDGIFGDEKLIAGAYVNGGIMPLVGGELAKAAFDHGYEEYGVDILKRYYDLISRKGETYLWYFPDGTPASVDTSTSPEAEPTDGWGSTAMLYALIEGLAGIEDKASKYSYIKLSPRWVAAGVNQAEVKVGYAASGAEVRYQYRMSDDQINLQVNAEADVEFHVMLPKGKKATVVKVDGIESEYENCSVKSSGYVDFKIELTERKEVIVTTRFANKR